MVTVENIGATVVIGGGQMEKSRLETSIVVCKELILLLFHR